MAIIQKVEYVQKSNREGEAIYYKRVGRLRRRRHRAGRRPRDGRSTRPSTIIVIRSFFTIIIITRRRRRRRHRSRHLRLWPRYPFSSFHRSPTAVPPFRSFSVVERPTIFPQWRRHCPESKGVLFSACLLPSEPGRLPT